MKQQLIPKHKLLLTKKYNNIFKDYLNILSLNNDELILFLKEFSNENTFFEYKETIDKDIYLNYVQNSTSLYDVLIEQIRMSNKLYNQECCEYLIFQLDSNGYFKNKDFYNHPFYSKEEIDYHINLLQNCEPYGCFTNNLKECLQLQCLHSNDKRAEIAYKLCNYLEEIVSNKLDIIINELNLSKEEIFDSFHFIQTLNPKPAANFAVQAIYTSVEFKIEIIDQKIQISLQQEDFNLIFDPDNTNENLEIQEYIKKQKHQYKQIINAIKKRNTTLLLIMQAICEHQKDFFLNHGHLNHLTMQEIANTCDLHVSTVSRAIQNKAFEFENQFYSLKKMFTHSGTNVSEQEIKSKIVQYIKNENSRRPLSDEKIRLKLLKENIEISRRTVQKYREQCHIPNASKRKTKE